MERNREVYRYKLYELERHGSCEVCGKRGPLFIQVEERYYCFQHGGKRYEGWTQHKCRSLFGHRECLIKMRR
jgi:hypothetical protein